MTEQTQSRVIMNIRDICKYPYGSVIAGKDGIVFRIPDDYYTIGLITPSLGRLRSAGAEKVLDCIIEASNRFYTRELQDEIWQRFLQTGGSSEGYPEKIPSTKSEIFFYSAKDYPNGYISGFQMTYPPLEGIPKDRTLFVFEAPIPEDGYLASRVAEEFERALMQGAEFRRMIKRWRVK